VEVGAMTKTGLLRLLAEKKTEAEGGSDYSLVPLELVTLLLEYINDRQIKEAVDEIPF